MNCLYCGSALRRKIVPVQVTRDISLRVPRFACVHCPASFADLNKPLVAQMEQGIDWEAFQRDYAEHEAARRGRRRWLHSDTAFAEENYPERYEAEHL